MPKYTVKPEKYDAPDAPVATEGPKEHYPTCYLPVSKEIIDALAVGDDVEVTIKGKVESLRASADQRNREGRNELTVSLRQVEAYPGEKDMQSAIEDGLGYGKKKSEADEDEED